MTEERNKDIKGVPPLIKIKSICKYSTGLSLFYLIEHASILVENLMLYQNWKFNFTSIWTLELNAANYSKHSPKLPKLIHNRVRWKFHNE